MLQDDRVNHQGQPIALVIAETLEQANHAATLVRVTYADEAGITDISRVVPIEPTQQKTDQGETPTASRPGAAIRNGALATAEVKVEQTYVIPRENHNPIEMHATIAAWDGDRLTLWDKTQWVHNTADEIAAVFGIPAENIRVISPVRWRRLRLRAANLAACDASRARRARYWPTGQGDAVAARDVLRRSDIGRTRSSASPSAHRATAASRPSFTTVTRRLPGMKSSRRRCSTRAGSCIPARTSTRVTVSRP